MTDVRNIFVVTVRRRRLELTVDALANQYISKARVSPVEAAM